MFNPTQETSLRSTEPGEWHTRIQHEHFTRVTRLIMIWAARKMPSRNMKRGKNQHNLIKTNGAPSATFSPWATEYMMWQKPSVHALYNSCTTPSHMDYMTFSWLMDSPWGMGCTTGTAHEPWIIQHPTGLWILHRWWIVRQVFTHGPWVMDCMMGCTMLLLWLIADYVRL